MDSPQPLSERVRALFDQQGARAYEGARRESVTALQHALQCAQLAEWAGASPALVVAALLHDIGHFIESSGSPTAGNDLDDAHEARALPWLACALGPEVTEPIRLHVAAKRYLVAVDVLYEAGLSPASRHSLRLQGGPMTADEQAAYEALPYAPDATLLRRWDDAAKTPGKTTPPLDWYLPLIDGLCEGPAPRRTVISAFDAS